jgi:uncharacterized integral membrane protein
MKVPLFLVPALNMSRIFVWVLRGAVFILLFGLALKNGDLVDLYFFFGQHLEIPVSLLVLLSFTLGAVLGLTAALSRNKVHMPAQKLARHTEDRQA